jgi:hypothetical protein
VDAGSRAPARTRRPHPSGGRFLTGVLRRACGEVAVGDYARAAGIESPARRTGDAGWKRIKRAPRERDLGLLMDAALGSADRHREDRQDLRILLPLPSGEGGGEGIKKEKILTVQFPSPSSSPIANGLAGSAGQTLPSGEGMNAPLRKSCPCYSPPSHPSPGGGRSLMRKS